MEIIFFAQISFQLFFDVPLVKVHLCLSTNNIKTARLNPFFSFSLYKNVNDASSYLYFSGKGCIILMYAMRLQKPIYI